jgi:hypothetical protein
VLPKREVWFGVIAAVDSEAGMKREAGDDSMSIVFYMEIDL